MLPCLTPLCIWHVLESIEFHLTFFFVFMYMLSLGIMQKGHPGRWGANHGWRLRKSYFAMFCYYNYSVNIDQHNQNINNLVHCFPPPPFGNERQGQIYIGATGSMAPVPEVPWDPFETTKIWQVYIIKVELASGTDWVYGYQHHFKQVATFFAKLKGARKVAKLHLPKGVSI